MGSLNFYMILHLIGKPDLPLICGDALNKVFKKVAEEVGTLTFTCCNNESKYSVCQEAKGDHNKNSF